MRLFYFFSVFIIFISCAIDVEKKKVAVTNIKKDISNSILINDTICHGIYKGAEFDKEHGDIGHQYSNLMSKVVGNQLKKLYVEEKYSKVDFEHIQMSTKGMNDGDNFVIYELSIPFKRVQYKCDAMTAFDHCGGWGHSPAIEKRKAGFVERGKTVMVDNILDISELKTTKEGLQEYWLQWKHIDYQKECGNN